MKRLLCILSCMNSGGAETFLMKLYRNIDKSKYQMDFCVNMPGKQFYEDEILALGGKLYKIPSKSEDTKEFKRQLTDIIKSGGYKNVLRVTSSAMGFMDLKIAKAAGAEICAARSSNSSDGGSFKSVIAHKLGKFLYGKYVDVKIAPSDLAAKYTFGEKAYKDGKVHILHNAVDLDVYKYSAESRKNIRNEFSIGENDLVIGHVGRFETQKNHSFLLEIFAEIKRKEKSAKLMLVGKGKLENEIKEKAKALGISGDVIFTGVRSDVPDILSAFDVFVFPSFYEGMPNTVIEAQATGLPAVISDTITREADITGLVDYLPLSKSAQDWAKMAVAKAQSERKDTKDDFIKNEYDIQSVVNKFTEMLFL